MAKLTANTLVTHPETGGVVLLAGGGDLPDWAVGLVGDHLLDNPDGQGDDGPPPKGGAGSGVQAWREYAARSNVEVPADASREDVIAALEAAGVRTE